MTAQCSIAELPNPEVLVVDDHKLLRREVSSRLRKHRLTVRTADSGAAALRVIRRANVGVAVIDLKMPKMDGIELAKQIRAVKGDLPIIFLTAYDNDKYRQRALAEGLRVERWIDKDPRVGIHNTLAAVLDALGRSFL